METKLKKNLAVQVIKDHNISKIEVHYDGGGDDGCVEEVGFLDHNQNTIDVKMDQSVQSEWDDLLYDMISNHVEWDWINNDGGYGQMHIDCTKNPWKVKIDHVQRVTEDHYYDDIDFDIKESGF